MVFYHHDWITTTELMKYVGGVSVSSKRIAVIPAYEPEEQLLDLLAEVTAQNFVCIVVDDGSGEAFTGLFEKAGAYAHVISYPENHGKGYAMKQAFSYILEHEKDDCSVVVLDCDGQHRISDAIKLCELVEQDKGVFALGSRRQSADSPLRSRFGNAVTRNVFKLVTGQKVYDTQTGLRASHISMLPALLEVPGDRYEYEMNVLLEFAKRKISLREIPIATIYINNNAGSHFHAIRDSFRVYKEILKFSASSLLGFVVDYLCYTALILAFGKAFTLPANIFARVISATVNFTVNRRLVFHGKETLWRSALKYFMLAAVILACNTGLLHVLTNMLHMNPYVAKVLVEVLLFCFSWLAQRTLVFRVNGNQKETSKE